ncbi:unnamed protein product [Euphydryas editha]|uniref:Rhabdovirus nucleocapsid domain-containing protein n=1 Tax=Euphydryas editha TaxID=104508 RepID=A0AAU9TPQ3_EUPED|nr:unnamed protein product [Euphydryas editha]
MAVKSNMLRIERCVADSLYEVDMEIDNEVITDERVMKSVENNNCAMRKSGRCILCIMALQVELDEDSSYYLETNELVTIEYKHPGLEVDLPSEWFAKEVTKSAFSSNANPYLHTWIHMIGALLGHQRSINARYIFEGNLADISLNAVLITWAFARGGELNPQFSRRRERYGEDIIPEGEGDEGDSGVDDAIWITTQGREAQTWYALLKNGGFKVPGVVSKVIRRQRDKIRNPREETIGEYVKNNFLY